ncbi:RagB/SusD family nutrient uptake outer membrane protein [Pedobacter frigidisoli]|uniref:RagB/SusD family nutrient uptake outer membrane protein n=1 Tax=Pedobacter frigidisoli TaxID=2530455 RepID=UPI00292F80F2|nr:RagB/SusD family nutrient uptake outer membrane protein [Pedobacter frigidisoli]
MKIKNILHLLSVAVILGLPSCEKYVDIKTQGNLVPGDIANYRALLNGTSSFENGPQIGDLSSDDVQLVDGSTQQITLSSDTYTYWKSAYSWQPVLYPIGSTTLQTDNNWNQMYNAIAYCNTIIGELPTATGGEAEKKALTAEALVHRADAYLMLMNTYAQPYTASTAGTDLGVPMVLTQTVSQSLKRPSSQSVYDQILKDLKTAVGNLPAAQAFNTLPSKASAYGELARCYLYMNDYSSANKYADSTLAIRSTLNDLSLLTTINSATYPIRRSDPEILLSKIAVGGISSFAPTVMRLSDDLLNILGTKDQRYSLFTVPASTISSNYVLASGRYFFRDRAMNEARNIGPNVPEMMLIKAEYYARNNDPSSAMLWVNSLRKKRFKALDYAELVATSGSEALKVVIEERRREFFCRMLRWWDMRRLKSEVPFQRNYTRVFSGTTYTLSPTSNRYTFQIPPYQIQLSPEIEQNP